MGIIDFIIHIDVHLGELIAQYGSVTYGILFLIVFAETGLVFTPFLPGDSLLFAAGMFSAQDAFDPIVLSTVLMIATLLGDNVNYWVGHYFGRKIVHNKMIPINQEHINKTEGFMKKHGGKTIFLARFMPIVRTFAPFVAGTGNMHYRSFLLYSIAGCITWVCGFVFAGYFFGNIPIIRDNFTLVVMGIIVLSVIPGMWEFTRNVIRKHRVTDTSS